MSALQVSGQRTSAALVADGLQRDLRKRTCTDLPCCVLFVVCWGLFGVSAYLGFANGNIHALDRFIIGRDVKGRICGQHSDVKDFPLTYFTLPEGHDPIAGVPWTDSTRSQLRPICTTKCPKAAAGDTGKPVAAREVGLCAGDMYNHSAAEESQPGLCTWYGVNTTQFAFYCVDLDVFDDLGMEWGRSLQDVRSAWPELAVAPIVAMVVGVMFLTFIHRCGAACIWVSLLVGALVPLGAGAWVFEEAMSGKPIAKTGLGSLSPSDQKLIAYGLWTLSGIWFVLLCCFARTIKSVIAVMRATSQFLKDVPSLMLQPVLVGLAQLIVFSVWLVVFVAVASIGAEEGDEKKCLAIGKLYCLDWSSSNQWYGLLFLVFMLYWILNFLHGLSHFGTSYAMSVWYFTRVDVMTGRKLPTEGGHTLCDCRLTIRSFCRGLVHHPGSLAFGAFVISLARVGRLLLWWANKDEESRPQNPLTKCVRRCVNCLADCFVRFIEFVSEHAYVEIALQGQGFCYSAQQAMAMAVLKPALFALVGRVAVTVHFFGVVTVIGGCVAAVGLLLALWPPAALHSATVPIAFAALVGLVVGEVMLHPFSAAARASLHCFCVDEGRARNLGLAEPEHTPQPLLRLVEENEGRAQRSSRV